MKQKAKWISAIMIALLAVGVLIISVARSADYNAPTGAKITMASVQKRLSHTTSPESIPKTTSKSNSQLVVQGAKKPTNQPIAPNPSTSTSTSNPAAKSLPNTGPGNVLLLSVLVTAISTAVHMVWQRSRLYKES